MRETEQYVKSLKEGNVSHETFGQSIIKVKDLAVHQLVKDKERVDLATLESALISDLKTARRLRHGRL